MTISGETAEAAVTWGLILKLGLTTGVFTAVFNQAAAALKDAWQSRMFDRRRGTTSAIGLVEVLTTFALECDARHDYNDYDRLNRNDPRHYDMPPLKYPDDVALDILPRHIAVGLADLQTEIQQAKRNVSITAEVVDPPEATKTADDGYLSVGQTAINLALRLRKEYRLGPYQGDTAKDVAASLSKKAEAAKKLQSLGLIT
ncbi:hypothetical protein [Mesorhizobium sp. M0187]|uniref:hypothetical protein n=1 Tax=Mesorhizobium sp. M0187 TaxID=2956908 RepID=UPI003336D66C